MLVHPAIGAVAPRLPNVLIIGAMKAGTSALHRALGRHPEVAVSSPKELNFFVGPPTGDTDGAWSSRGNWHRGPAWYAEHFRADVPVRVEASPGYTSPGHPEAAARIAAALPDAHLVCLVRDPIERAVSQYRHHRREGTEPRPLAEALLDPGSQYLSRSRYAERLAPFLAHFPREQLTVVVSERLRTDPRDVLRRLFSTLGLTDHWDPLMAQPAHVAEGPAPDLPEDLRAALTAALRDDAEALRALLGDPLAPWRV